MIKFKEFNLRERTEIVDNAMKCSKELSAQPLIDYFHKAYRTKFENGKTIVDKIIDKYYPDCSDMFRDTLHAIIVEFIFNFESQLESFLPEDGKAEKKEQFRDYFRDFFTFHNEANKNIIPSIDEYFDKWYDARVDDAMRLQ